jgi:8-oxo-dGTP diphosphatase
MNIPVGFTLCFLTHGEQVLMLLRRFPPNQGFWNGVGGHIEPGETPTQAVIREVAEETGYIIDHPRFAGVMTWDGFEIPPGGIAMFTVEVPHLDFINNHEGVLAWKPKTWACTAPDVVDNIHVFLPGLLAGEPPRHYHFSYREGIRVRDEIASPPTDFDPNSPARLATTCFEQQRGDFLLSFDKDRLQMDVIEGFLAEQSYWAQGRSHETILRSIHNAVCIGIYHQGAQVAFTRLVTDQATFAWLCDVFVLEIARGEGLGKWMVEAACHYCDAQGIKRTLLATRDAHRLYSDYGGFQPLENPEKWMTRLHPGYN